MIESVLHLFKIHREMILGNPAVIVEHVFGIAPESLNAVDVIAVLVGQRFGVIEPMVLTPTLQGIVASEGVRIIDRSLSGVLLDMGHQFFGSHILHHLGIYPAIPL